MAVIYLKHPIHGSKVATLDIEADFDEQNGWTRYNLDKNQFEENTTQVMRRGRPKKTEKPVKTLEANKET